MNFNYPVFLVGHLEKHPIHPDFFNRPVPNHSGPLSSDEVEYLLDSVGRCKNLRCDGAPTKYEARF